MPRYVILEHDWPTRHWDLFLEAETILRAWRLLVEPTSHAVIPAEPAPDHRLFYLDHEGPVSGNRGQVTRFDFGNYDLIEESPGLLRLHLAGHRFAGPATLTLHGAQWLAQLT